ncbi:MAG: hypothetical protein CL840_20790 [Crocinitomicaceae bacterium]|nr:hypothetical protein [Crocinitomicaceae bacterium]|tara:strand:+ start:2038 stop:4500 length:2463 start_codon:yes stop_codon:yes gene_type:complete
MKNQLLIILVVAFTNAIGFAQLTKRDYTPLSCTGEIPNAFLETAEEKYKRQAGTISSQDDKRTQENIDAFYQSSNYMLDRVLLGGDVLFGDTLTRYVNKIADALLKNDPHLRSQIQFYAFKSPYVNAFSTDQGYIFVNIGLIAQVANEVELAYVIAHEIIHFREKHNTKGYVESDLIRRGKGEYKEENNHDRINSYYQYSKNLETEADKEGLKMLAKSPYNALKAKGLFDVLLYSYLPFDEEEFDASFLANNAFEFPETLLMDSTKDIKARDEIDDKHSTHPNIKNRRKSTYKYFKRLKGSTDDKKTYLHSKEEFRYVRDVARFEVIRQNIIDHRYDRAIYNIYLMNEKYPDNLYLNKCLITSLEGSLLYKEEGISNEVMSRYKKVEGSSQAVSFWLKKIKKKDLAVVLAGKNYETLRMDPDNPQLQKSLHRNLSRVIHKYNMYEDDFEVNDSLLGAFEPEMEEPEVEDSSSTKVKEEKKETIDDIFGSSDDDFAYVEEDEPVESEKKETRTEDDEIDDFFADDYTEKRRKKSTPVNNADTTDAEKSKYDKIKERKKEEEVIEEVKKDFRKMVFYDMLTEDIFIKAFEKASEDKTEELTPTEELKRKRIKEKEDKLIARKGHALGINKITILDPVYYVIDDRYNETEVLYIKSETQKGKLEEYIKSASGKTGLSVDVLNPKNLTELDIESFNAMIKLKEWVNESTNHEVEDVPTLLSLELDGISEALGTKYVATQEVYNIKLSKNEAQYILSMAYLVTIPWAIGKLATPEAATYFKFRLVDIEKQEIVMETEYFYKGKDNGGTLKGCLYNSFIQVRRDKQ